MKKLVLLGLGWLPLILSAEDADWTALKKELSQERIGKVEAWRAAHPDSESDLEAINLLLESYQTLGKTTPMIPLLEQRYRLLIQQPQVNLQHLFDRTFTPLVQLKAANGYRHESMEWIARARKDFENSPAKAQINQLLDQIETMIAPPRIGDTPALSFTSTDGAALDLKNFRGKYVLLEFWVTTCEICARQKDVIIPLYRDYHAQGFEVLGFCQDPELERLVEHARENGMTWPQCHDADPKNHFAQKLKIDYIPFNMLVDPEGKVIKINLREHELLETIEGLYKGK